MLSIEIEDNIENKVNNDELFNIQEIKYLLNNHINTKNYDDTTIDLLNKSVQEYMKQLEADNYEVNNRINEYIEQRRTIIEELKEMRENLNKDGFVGYADNITDILYFVLEEEE